MLVKIQGIAARKLTAFAKELKVFMVVLLWIGLTLACPLKIVNLESGGFGEKVECLKLYAFHYPAWGGDQYHQAVGNLQGLLRLQRRPNK